MRTKYIWKNWATSDELSQIFGVSQRRIQQVISEFFKKNLVEVAIIVVDIGSANPISKPIYKRLGA